MAKPSRKKRKIAAQKQGSTGPGAAALPSTSAAARLGSDRGDDERTSDADEAKPSVAEPRKLRGSPSAARAASGPSASARTASAKSAVARPEPRDEEDEGVPLAVTAKARAGRYLIYSVIGIAAIIGGSMAYSKFTEPAPKASADKAPPEPPKTTPTSRTLEVPPPSSAGQVEPAPPPTLSADPAASAAPSASAVPSASAAPSASVAASAAPSAAPAASSAPKPATPKPTATTTPKPTATTPPAPTAPPAPKPPTTPPKAPEDTYPTL